MENQKRHSRKLLSILLVLCMVLSIVPVTAFASEDTDPTKSENAVGEETQLTEQQNATEETKMGAVTPAPKDETKATDNGVSGTSAESKNDKAEDLQPSEQPDAEKKSASVDTSNSVIKKASVSVIKKASVDANAENKTEKSDKSNEKSSAEVATLALEQPKPDYLPQGVMYFSDGYKHAYHTRVDVTANVSVKDSTGTVVETTQVSKSSGEFNFITEGFPSAEVLQTAVENLQTEIETPYKARGTVTSENESAGPIIDHFESASLYTFTPTSGNPVDFSSDLEAAKQYFNEHPDATGTFTVIRDVHEYQIYNYTYDLKVTATDESSQNSIGDVDIEGVTFNYEPGDAPKATAYKCDPWDEQYDIEYEYWEEMETNVNGESIPVKYWYSDESKNNALAQDKKITTFEDGKTYMYSLSLKARDGNTFAANSKVMVNGTNVNNANITNTGTGLFVVAVRTIKPETVQLQNISIVEINNATISFKVGDKPVFTGKTAENVPYIYQSEFWSTDGGKKYHYSADFWNDNNPDDLFTEFESGKTYTYGIYFKAKEGYCFTTDTKLKINGKYYDYDITDYDPLLQYPNGGYATMWVDTNLTMTPQASGTTPEYKITEGANGTWTQNSDGTLTFRANGDFSKFTGVKVDGTLIDAKNYTAVSGSTVITLKADYLKTLSGGTHKITVVYTDGECSTNFEVKQTTQTEGDKPDTTTPTGNKDTTSPQTGDNSNLLLWVALLFVSGAGVIGATVYSKKKRVR